MVGAEGFELSTYGTQNRRATRLRYAPTVAADRRKPAERKAPIPPRKEKLRCFGQSPDGGAQHLR
jgi:hypothetical protein